MKKLLTITVACVLAIAAHAESVPFGKGTVTVTPVAKNAVRIQYAEHAEQSDLPDWLYVRHDREANPDVKVDITPEDYANGRDPQLDAALRELKKLAEAKAKEKPLSELKYN